MPIIGLLRSLFGLLDKIGGWFANQQLIDAGKAEQAAQEAEKVEQHVEQAQAAVAVPDPVRDKRLSDRFDRSAGN